MPRLRISGTISPFRPCSFMVCTGTFQNFLKFHAFAWFQCWSLIIKTLYWSSTELKLYIIKTNKMHTFFINDLIQLYYLRHVSNNQVFISGILVHAVLWHFFSCVRISSLVEVRMCLIPKIPQHCMYKSSWGWTLGCSKHVEDNTIELNH